MCSHSVAVLYEATQMLVMVDYVLEMTVKKSCMVNVDCLSIYFSCSRLVLISFCLLSLL